MSYQFEPQSLSGKNIVLTGGTTGIGRAIAQRLVASGANVLLFGRHEQELQDALGEIHALQDGQDGQPQGTVHGLTADQSKPEDVDRVFREADEKMGGVDILVNNAAVAAKSVVDMEFAEIQQVIETNLLGYLNCTKHAIERMTAKGEGHIVAVGSMSDTVREEGSDVYVATKSAVNGFVESLRKHINDKNIKVTLIEPGLVATDMTVDQVPKEQQEEAVGKMEMLRAEDIAECVHYTLIQPKRCDIVQVQLRPRKQPI